MKILLTATVQSHICQFHMPLIKMLKSQGHEVHVAAKYNLDVKPGLNLDNVDKVFDVPFNRSPFSFQNIKAFRILRKIIKENKYDIIHCNTPMGGVVTRFASLFKKANTIYTAHGFHFYKGAPFKNWLLYFPMEWLLSFKTDTLICINKEDYNFSLKHLHAKKTEYIHGIGLDKSRFNDRLTKDAAKQSLNIPKDSVVLLAVGELNDNKNHRTVINALSSMKNKNIHLYIAGAGKLETELKALTVSLGIEENVTFLGFTRQLSAYFSAADIFLHPSFREGLPVAVMEAMEMGIPVICSNIRGNSDLIKEGEGGYLCNPADTEDFAVKIDNLVNNEETRNAMSVKNRENIKDFYIEKVLKEIENIYTNYYKTR